MWWNSMSTLQQVMFVIACAATALLVLQIVMMLIGASGAETPDGVSDVDFSGADVPDGGDILNAPDVDFDISSVDGADIPDSVDGMDGIDGIDGASTDGADVGHTGGGAAAFGMRLLSLRSIIAFVSVGAWMCYTLCYFLDWYYAVIISVACGFGAACAMAATFLGLEKLQTSGNLDPNNTIGKIGTVYLTIPANRSGVGKIHVVVQERYAEYSAVTNGEELKTATEIKVVGNAGNNVLIVEKYRKPAITIEDDGK